MLSSSANDDDLFGSDSDYDDNLPKDDTPELKNLSEDEWKGDDDDDNDNDNDDISDTDHDSDNDYYDNKIEPKQEEKARGAKRKRTMEKKNDDNQVISKRSRRKQRNPKREGLAKRPFQRIIRPILHDQAEQKNIDGIRIQESAVNLLLEVSNQHVIEFTSEVWRAAALHNRKEPNESDVNAAKYLLQRCINNLSAPSQQHVSPRYGSLPAKNRGIIASSSMKVYRRLNQAGVLGSNEVQKVIKKEKAKQMRIKRKKLNERRRIQRKQQLEESKKLKK